MAHEEEVLRFGAELDKAVAEGDSFACNISAVLQAIEISYNLGKISLGEAGLEFSRQANGAIKQAKDLGWI